MRAGTVGAILLAIAATGCLPLGDPPRGDHLSTARDDLFVQFQVTKPGTPARVLVGRDSPPIEGTVVVGGFDLYDVPAADPVTGGSTPKLLLKHVTAFGCDTCGGFGVDARGRLFMPQQQPAPPGIYAIDIVRVDPTTAASMSLGPSEQVFLSADRTLILLGMGKAWRVRDLDDHDTALPVASDAAFAGNDIYLITTDHDLVRLHGDALTATPEVAATNVADFRLFDTPRGALLLLARVTVNASGPTTHALFDTKTFTEIAVPGETTPTFGASISPSPSGRYVVVSSVAEGGAPTLALLDLDAGTAELKPVATPVFAAHWRPGHDEAWLETNVDVQRLRPGQPLELLEGGGGLQGANRPDNSVFTSDGAFFLSFESPTQTIVLRSADAPAAEPFPLYGAGRSFWSYWSLPDGRGVVESYTTYQLNDTLSLVDPVARTSRALASGGHVVAVGAHRVLALLDWVKSSESGTLTLVDLDTGKKTVLGENVYNVALEAPETALERLPAGARVAFLVRNRIASPYDGLWVATLP